MHGCPGNGESVGTCALVCLHSLPQHGDLVLDAALLSLQRLLRDALHRKHPATQLLLGQNHFRERPPENAQRTLDAAKHNVLSLI